MVESKRYVDVNVFIYWLGGHPRYGETAKKWVKRMEEEKGFITSTLTLYEVLIIMSGLTGKSLSNREFISDVVTSMVQLRNLTYIPVEAMDYVNAIKYMEAFKLDFEDAIHYAIAKRCEVESIVSNDRDYDRTDIRREF